MAAASCGHPHFTVGKRPTYLHPLPREKETEGVESIRRDAWRSLYGLGMPLIMRGTASLDQPPRFKGMSWSMRPTILATHEFGAK